MLFAECRHAAAYIIGARLEIRRRELYQMRRFAHILFGEAAVVTAGVPRRMPLVIKGLCGSFGIVFLFAVI